MQAFCADYAATLSRTLQDADWSPVERLGSALLACWREGREVFLCGNGGSDANALHLANDLLYGIAGGARRGLRVRALSGNSSVTTCLANDLGYERIFAAQLETLGAAGDVLVVLSGSGNSPNVLAAIEVARGKRMETFAILGFGGGRALAMVDTAIHFAIDDMQIAEDCQLVVGHMLMRWLRARAPDVGA